MYTYRNQFFSVKNKHMVGADCSVCVLILFPIRPFSARLLTNNEPHHSVLSHVKSSAQCEHEKTLKTGRKTSVDVPD